MDYEPVPVLPLDPPNPADAIELSSPDGEKADDIVYAIPRIDTLNNVQAALQQNDFLVHLSKKVVANANRSTVAYCGLPGAYESSVHVAQVSVYFRKDIQGKTMISSNILKYQIFFTRTDYATLSGVFLRHILQEYQWHVQLFAPRSLNINRICEFEKISADVLRFESDRLETDAVMEYWMPMVHKVKQIQVGCVSDIDDYDRCLRIYRKHFHGRIVGWQGEEVLWPLVNKLRRILPCSGLHTKSIPISHFIRWVKGWMAGLEGYSHITQAIFSNPKLRIHHGVFRFFFNGLQEDVNLGDDKIMVKNQEGRKAILSLNAYGAIHFDVIPLNGEEPVPPIRRVELNVDELEDIDTKYAKYMVKDREESRNITEYATIREVEGEP